MAPPSAAPRRHEEQQPDQHSPQSARGGTYADDLLRGFDVVLALRIDRHDGHAPQVRDEVRLQRKDLVVGGAGVHRVVVPDDDESGHCGSLMSWTVRDSSLLVHAPPVHSWRGDRGRPT
jgi:hypothetical protein